MKNLIHIMLAFFLLIFCADNKASSNESDNKDDVGIKGEWEVTHIERKNKDTTIVQNPWHRSIYIYTDKYYSIAAATEERPSAPELDEGEKIDPDYFVNAYLRYISNSGTYEVIGDSIFYNIVVAKSPTLMNDRRRLARHVTLEKDNMILTSGNGNYTTRITLRRLNN